MWQERAIYQIIFGIRHWRMSIIYCRKKEFWVTVTLFNISFEYRGSSDIIGNHVDLHPVIVEVSDQGAVDTLSNLELCQSIGVSNREDRSDVSPVHGDIVNNIASLETDLMSPQTCVSLDWPRTVGLRLLRTISRIFGWQSWTKNI